MQPEIRIISFFCTFFCFYNSSMALDDIPEEANECHMKFMTLDNKFTSFFMYRKQIKKKYCKSLQQFSVGSRSGNLGENTGMTTGV